jgi:hypothetical protein
LDSLSRPVGGDDRTAVQRYADALVELARRQLDGGDLPAKNDVRSHMFVGAKAQPGTPWDRNDVPPSNDDANDAAPSADDDVAGDHSSPNGPPPGPQPAPGGLAIRLTDGVVVGGGALSDKALQRIACDATITRVVFRPDGHVLDLGRAVRVVTSAQWRALLLRDGGCVIPGHDCPASHCQAHHLISWLDGGPTDLRNLAAVCTFGHTLLYERGYRLYLNLENCWVLEKPTGEQIVGLPLGQTGHTNIASIEAAMLNGPRGPCGD